MSSRPLFTLEDANRAHDEWGANCGPAAIAAVLGLTLDQVRPHLGDFERKRYTNPTLMYETLRRLGVAWTSVRVAPAASRLVWPRLGLVRIQWEGPWTLPGVPMAARYRHTHWIGARVAADVEIFDLNAICVGGWLPLPEWSDELVPWLLREAVPRADGRWHQTHVLELAAGR